MILANETYPIESVFNTLRIDAFVWSRDTHYPDIFNSSSDIQYIKWSYPRTTLSAIHVAIHNTCHGNKSNCYN